MNLEILNVDRGGVDATDQIRTFATVPTSEFERDENPSQDEVREYPKRAELGLISMAIGLSLILTGLVSVSVITDVYYVDDRCAKDSTIVATAVPSITSQFKTYSDGWYSSV